MQYSNMPYRFLAQEQGHLLQQIGINIDTGIVMNMAIDGYLFIDILDIDDYIFIAIQRLYIYRYICMAINIDIDYYILTDIFKILFLVKFTRQIKLNPLFEIMVMNLKQASTEQMSYINSTE